MYSDSSWRRQSGVRLIADSDIGYPPIEKKSHSETTSREGGVFLWKARDGRAHISNPLYSTGTLHCASWRLSNVNIYETRHGGC